MVADLVFARRSLVASVAVALALAVTATPRSAAALGGELGVAVRDALRATGLEPVAAEVMQRAATAVPLGNEDALAVARLLDALEEIDDVQQVCCNAGFPGGVLARLA